MPSPVGQRSASTRPVAGRKPSSASSAYSRTSTAWPPGAGASSNPSGSPAAIGELVGDEVAAGDELRDRVLDLEPRVHLEEGRPAAVRRRGTRRCRRSRTRPPGRGSAPRRRAAPGAARSTAGDGVSSRTFWWRRWIEQSRSPSWTPAPCASNRTWISTWRPPSTSRSRISRSSPNAARRLAPGGGERVGERLRCRGRCACPCRRRRPRA